MESARQRKICLCVGVLGLAAEILLAAFRPPLRPTPQPWSTYVNGLGTFSSPRVADLNGDGIMDVITGAGREEFIATDSAVIALDGATGAMLWHVGARDQIFGSASLHDINRDGTSDVIIGGRSAELMAIDGARGTLLWRFLSDTEAGTARDAGLFNFYNPQLLPDQNGDDVEDLLVANGGDVLTAPENPDRPPGHLMVISGSDGRLIAKARLPDGRETYLSPVVADLEGDGRLDIVFGSGGETVGGHLFRTTLQDVLQEDIASAVVLASSQDKGFIGPPVLVDITDDGILDIVANAVNGRMLAFDGSDNAPLWTVEQPGTEAFTSIAVGYFTSDAVPDFFASYAVGRWPNLGWSRQLMVDGRTGEIAFTDSLGLYQTSSPVVADVNQDGRDDVLLNVNYEVINAYYLKRFYAMLVMVDFTDGRVAQFGEAFDGSNLSSTPWLGDLDADGLLDVIYCHTPDTLHTYTFNGFQVNRIVTDIEIGGPIVWGAYMGSRYDGIFRLQAPASSE